MKNTRLFPNHQHAFCDVYVCQNQASYFVGRPDATLAATFKLCDECVEAILTNLEDKHMNLVLESAELEGKFHEEQEQENPGATSEPSNSNMPLSDGKLNQHTPLEQTTYGPQEKHMVEEYQIEERLKEMREKAEKELEDKTVEELRDMAKEKDIPKYYEMKKQELIDALMKGDTE